VHDLVGACGLTRSGAEILLEIQWQRLAYLAIEVLEGSDFETGTVKNFMLSEQFSVFEHVVRVVHH